MTNGVFSEYELRSMGIKFAGATESTYQTADCVGTCEETMNAKVVTKMCRGVAVKTTVRGDGTGTLSIEMHMPKAIYDKAYGMELETLIEGVKAYGRNSVHKAFSITQDVFDEDGVEKFKAYPNCILQSGVTRTIENGAEEVAQISMEVSVMPDEYGNGMYEALASELPASGSLTAANWMTTFTPKLAQATTA